MRYFKHFTTMMDDEAVCYIRDKMGIEGYGIYVAILEVVASQVDGEKTHYSRPIKHWIEKLGLRSRKKLDIFLELVKSWPLYSVELNANREKPSQLLEYNIVDNVLLIDIPKLKKFRDEYTIKKSKNSGQTPDIVQTNAGQTPENIQRKREEKNIKEKNKYSAREEPPRKSRGILGQATDPSLNPSLDFSSFKNPALVKRLWEQQKEKTKMQIFYNAIIEIQSDFEPAVWEEAIKIALCAETPWGMASIRKQCEETKRSRDRFPSQVKENPEDDEVIRSARDSMRRMRRMGKTDSEIKGILIMANRLNENDLKILKLDGVA